eukprot:848698-Rhodomonas_salina.1
MTPQSAKCTRPTAMKPCCPFPIAPGQATRAAKSKPRRATRHGFQLRNAMAGAQHTAAVRIAAEELAVLHVGLA